MYIKQEVVKDKLAVIEKIPVEINFGIKQFQDQKVREDLERIESKLF